jgi:PPOX class probable F420-dependent enzyme
MSQPIPKSHLDLLHKAVNGVLTTLMPDGQPQMSIVWADYDSGLVLINTTLERQKGKNMRMDPKVNVLIIDPSNGSRYLEIRGRVLGYTQVGAISHADKQTRAYSNNKKNHFYGDIYPREQQELETRVIFKISPSKVNTDAIFS